jgi:hypothetical protein
MFNGLLGMDMREATTWKRRDRFTKNIILLSKMPK